MPKRIHYPTHSLPPGATPVPIPAGWEAIGPGAQNRSRRPLLETSWNPAAPYTTTNTTYGSGTVEAVATKRLPKVFQPSSHSLPDGVFSTVSSQTAQGWQSPEVRRNAGPPITIIAGASGPVGEIWVPFPDTAGWEVLSPNTSRKRKVYQPDSVTFVPGAFATATARVSGWETLSPLTVRARPRIPPRSDTLPDGVFITATTVAPWGWQTTTQPLVKGRAVRPADSISLTVASSTVATSVVSGWGTIQAQTGRRNRIVKTDSLAWPVGAFTQAVITMPDVNPIGPFIYTVPEVY